MSSHAVNARREYDNSGREEQAAHTRRRIVDAARQVVVRNGYVATTMVAIAKEARVSRETVYKAFRSKPELIKRVYDVSLVGDEDPIPLRDRPAYRAMVEDPTAEGTLRRYAAIVREIYHRLGPLLGVLLIAARSGEPELLGFLEQTDRESLQGARHIAELVAATGALRPDLDRERAADTIWALRSPEMHYLLTTVRGWPAQEYERWLAATLVDALLQFRRDGL
jgi:AcrR family transcriptional regulator